MSADRYLQIDGARLRYRDEGGGLPVVLVHGWTLDLQMWEPQVEMLRDRFRLVRFDRRGFGLSSGAPDIEADASDARSLCRELGIARAAFVGMSQGARVLERLVVESAELIGCVVFDGAPDMRAGGNLTNADIPVMRLRELARTQGLAAFRQTWAEHPLSKLVTQDRRMHALLTEILERYPGNDLMGPGAEPSPESGTRPDLSVTDGPPKPNGPLEATAPPTATGPFALDRVRVPALVLNGELDLESRRRAGELMAKLLPNAERILIPRAGHMANLDNPPDYNGGVARFISRAMG